MPDALGCRPFGAGRMGCCGARGSAPALRGSIRSDRGLLRRNHASPAPKGRYRKAWGVSPRFPGVSTFRKPRRGDSRLHGSRRPAQGSSERAGSRRLRLADWVAQVCNADTRVHRRVAKDGWRAGEVGRRVEFRSQEEPPRCRRGFRRGGQHSGAAGWCQRRGPQRTSRRRLLSLGSRRFRCRRSRSGQSSWVAAIRRGCGGSVRMLVPKRDFRPSRGRPRKCVAR